MIYVKSALFRDLAPVTFINYQIKVLLIYMQFRYLHIDVARKSMENNITVSQSILTVLALFHRASAAIICHVETNEK